MKSPIVKLQIINHSGWPVPRRFLTEWVHQMGRLATRKIDSRSFRGREMTLVFLKDKEARALNKKYRGKNYATDVLSFSTEGDPDSLGELVICPSVISRQAREHGLLVREELGYMVLHGFLHLLGYDHETNEREAREMFALQDDLFERLLSLCQRRPGSTDK